MEDEAGVVELVDTQDLKSCALLSVRVQVPPLVQKPSRVIGRVFVFSLNSLRFDRVRQSLLFHSRP